MKTLGSILHNLYLVNKAIKYYLYKLDISATNKCLLSQLMLNSNLVSQRAIPVTVMISLLIITIIIIDNIYNMYHLLVAALST